MRSRFSWLLAAACCFLTSSAWVFASEMLGATKRYDTSLRIHIIPGRSQTSIALPIMTARRMEVRHIVEASCPVAPPTTVRVRNFQSRVWENVRNQNGYLGFDLQAIDAVGFEFVETRFNVTCTLLVTVFMEDGAGGPTPDPGQWQERLLGRVNYLGDWEEVEIGVDPRLLMHSFRVAIPAFCSETEIVEAGTVTEGVYDAGMPSPTRAGRYLVANGPTRVGSIRLTLNGTRGCAIPVYGVVRR